MVAVKTLGVEEAVVNVATMCWHKDVGQAADSPVHHIKGEVRGQLQKEEMRMMALPPLLSLPIIILELHYMLPLRTYDYDLFVIIIKETPLI